MKKRMLCLDELAVESFPVHGGPDAERDAVPGRAAPTDGYLCSMQTFNPCCLGGGA